MLIVGLFYYGITMPIKNIYIKGNEIITDDEIIEVSALGDYPSFLLTKTGQIEESLEKIAYIKEAKLKKKFGNVIEITVVEYQPIAFTMEGQIILENGNVLDNVYDLTDVPILINSLDDSDKLENFALKFAQIEENILRQISQIEYSPVSVDEERFLLYMNDGNLVYITLTKINKLNKYNQIKDKLEGKIGIIYLDSGNYVELKKEVVES